MNTVAQRLGHMIERKVMEDSLKRSEATLREQKISLEQKNAALREVVAQIETETPTIDVEAMNVPESVPVNQ